MQRSASAPASLPQRGDASPLSPTTCVSAPTPRSWTIDETDVNPPGIVGSAVADDGVGSAVADYDASSFASMEADNPIWDLSPLSRTKSCVRRYPAYSKSGAASAAPTTPSQMVVSTTVGKTKKGKGKNVEKNLNKVFPHPSEFGQDFPISSLRGLTPKEMKIKSQKEGRVNKANQQMSED